MIFPDFSEKFLIYTDASNYGLGAVLSQIRNGKDQPIAYASRHLNTAEVKYSTVEKEAAALVFGIKRFRHYLQDEPFTIISDHRPLQWLQTFKDETGRLGRWAIQLSNMKFTVQYRPGRVHENADFLSRVQMNLILARPDDNLVMCQEQQKDPLCKAILAFIRKDSPWNKKDGPMPLWAAEKDFFFMEDGLLCKHYEPTSTKRRRFAQRQVVVPLSLRKQLLQEYHDSPLSGHLAYRRTVLRLRDKYFWPSMLSDVKQYCFTCEPCALGRRMHGLKAFLNPLELTTKPFEVIGMDFLGPVKPPSLLGNNYVLVITDYFTKWIEAVPLPNYTALVTCKALMDRIILRHGPPKAIITDRGSNFTSELFSALCKALNIKRMTTTAYHPQTNGQTERFNKTVAEMLRKYLTTGFEKWEDMLGPVTFAYNNSTHSSTLETPYFLNHGRDPVMPIDQFLLPLPTAMVTPSDYRSQTMRCLHEAFQQVKTNLAQAREQQKIQYDKRVKQLKFNVGDKVLLNMRTPMKGVSKKLIPRFIGPFRILKLNDNDTVVIQQHAGKQTQLVHVNRIKPLFESMIWKDEPFVDFLDIRISKEANTLLLENVTNLETPFPFEEIESQPIASETCPLITEILPEITNPISVVPTLPNPLLDPSTIPIQPERRLGLRPRNILRPVVRY